MTAIFVDDLSYADLFCGAGGSIKGMVNAGFEFKFGANHWDRAIETVGANFREADLLCADINHVDMRRLPKTKVLWASVICTELSPAGGKRRNRGQMEMMQEEGHVPAAAFERTRACALDVIRATEVHRYSAVIVENVIEFATDWELFDWWLDGMHKLGYRSQIVCVSSAHVYGEGNAPAPQWRDRIYIVFTLEKMRRPDLDLRPPALCAECGDVVRARQAWKRPGQRVGKYGPQYNYRCPNTRCRHAIVEPFVAPAETIIDWDDVGTRIGDRPRPLAAATMRRIGVGCDMFGQPVVVAAAGNTYEAPGSSYVRAWPSYDSPLPTRTGTASDGIATAPFIFNVNHHGDDGRPYPAHAAPLSPRTTKIGDGLATTQPFVTMLRANNRPTGVDEPLATLTTARNHYLTVPPGAFLSKHHGGLDYGPIEHMNKSVGDPMPTVVGKPNISLVVPYRRGRAKTTLEPLHTLATRDSAALCSVAVDPMDCYFRMLKPREHLRGQRIDDDYIVEGNKGEQTMQAGGAVSSNVAQWLGQQIKAVL